MESIGGYRDSSSTISTPWGSRLPDLVNCCPDNGSEATAQEIPSSPPEKARAVSKNRTPDKVDFVEFQLHAWQVDTHTAQVMVQISPAGGMRRPFIVACELTQLVALRQNIADQWLGKPETMQRVIEAGRELARILLPPPVSFLLLRSLERSGPRDGVRLRLCCDETLVDVPWEFLYWDLDSQPSLGNFLALSPRLSLVREVPRAVIGNRLLSPSISILTTSGGTGDWSLVGTRQITRGRKSCPVQSEGPNRLLMFISVSEELTRTKGVH